MDEQLSQNSSKALNVIIEMIALTTGQIDPQSVLELISFLACTLRKTEFTLSLACTCGNRREEKSTRGLNELEYSLSQDTVCDKCENGKWVVRIERER